MLRFIKYFGLAVISVALLSCDKTPALERTGDPGDDSHTGGSRDVSIAYLLEQYVNRPKIIDSDLRVTGTVVSNDRYGNFYKTLIVRDGTGAIEIKIDKTDIYQTYKFGSEVTVYCNSLVLGSYGGAVQMGIASDDINYQTGYIPETRLGSIIRSAGGETAELIPEVKTIASLTRKDIGAYAMLSDVQFEDDELGRPWSDEDADTNRYLTDLSGNRLAVRTSRYAEFASRLIPGGSGVILGIIGYFNGEFQLTIITTADVLLEEPRF